MPTIAMPAFEDSLPWSLDVGAAARATVRARLADLLPRDALHDAELVATELATNAFAHAPPLVEGRIVLRIEVVDEGVRFVVIDGGEGFVPTWEDTPGPGTAGGLRVVDKIAIAWGVSDDGANAVWAEVAHVRGVVLPDESA
jgi:anti-sigma regulatory factor (Ser/Thr protein kinase)